MRRPRPRWILAALVAAPALWAAVPAVALEIFGIRLWGRDEQEEGIEVIDPLPFTVELQVDGGPEGLEGTLERASGLYSGQDRPASGRGGLLARAKGDYRRILAALYDNAYYGGEISILLAGREAADLTLDSPMPDPVPVTIRVSPGPRFRFGQAVIVNRPPPNPRRDDERTEAIDEAFRPGAQADAGVISDASADAVTRWRHLSYAKASETDRTVVADHATNLLDAVVTLDPGRKAEIGRVTVEGSRRVDPGFIEYMTDLPAGSNFDPDRIRAAQERLGRLGVFRSVRIEEAEAIAPDGTLDIAVRVEDGPPRTIGFGATISTIDGAGVEAFWAHRNLFGRAERLRFDASVTGLGVTINGEDFDYAAGVSFLRPGVIDPDIDFLASLSGRRLDLDNYREQSVTARVGLQRTFARNLNGEVSVYATKARFEDFFGTRDFLMFGVAGRGDYDRRNDKLDPTRGYYLLGEATPFYEAEFGNFAARGSLEGRIYRGVDADDRFVLAARAKIGSYVGPPDAESPPDQLFFAGGAGSIRGYAYRSIGVEITNANGKTGIVGGRSLVEGSGELRVRINERFGAVGFLDAGYVGATSSFGGSDSDLRAGAGAGVRYFTGLGPLRVDVATPLNPRDDDSLVALYIGIGQAF
ncbi:MAG: outer membrane protein assembly factor [Rhodobacteraceae bacterium]|nr:outer membrane protein assembly factor [Paracoccaceae bacterium]